MAEVLARTNAIFLGLEAGPQVGGRSPWVPIPQGDASQAFAQALADLPPEGGVLYVMPGSYPYEFPASVPVTKPNVTLEFVGGSTLTFPGQAAGPDAMFRVLGAGFRCRGARVVFAIDDVNNTPDRSCFRIEADDAELEACSFDLRQLAAPTTVIRSFSCVRARSDPTAGEPLRQNLRVARCTFVLRAGVAQAEPWIVVDPALPRVPRGVVGVQAQRVRGCVLSENTFRGEPAAAKGDCGPALYLVDVEETLISTSTFRGLRTSPGGSAPDRGALARLSRETLEGHHTVLSACVFEDLDCAHVVALDDVQYDSISGNVFDRVGPGCHSVVRAVQGSVLGVVGNVFSRIAGPAAGAAGAEGAVHLDGLRNVTLSGNVFSEIGTGKAVIDLVPGTCSNVQIAPAQALADAP